MRLRTVIFALLGLSFIATMFAEAPVCGSKQYEAVTVEDINSVGLIKLNGTTVNTVHLTGSLIAQHAKIKALDIIGEANLKDTTVKEGGTVLGSLQATRTVFEGAITILSQKAVFTASRLEGITIQQDGSFKGKQVIELKQGTVVNGPIHFDSGKGEVILFSGCQVLGDITGGKVVKK